ncbi:hypothetical protein FRB99_002430 [Tulasnella sp. 403]|nr:hypothetical protein FRB99_002430 [Tulasnella sp. 403]
MPHATLESDSRQKGLDNGHHQPLANALPGPLISLSRIRRFYADSFTYSLSKSLPRPPPPRALQIPELLRMICEHLSREDVKSFLLVSSAFFEVAADRIWRVLSDMKPLLHLWSTITRRTEHNWFSLLPFLDFFLSPTPVYGERFALYAKRVRSIGFTSFCYHFCPYDKHQTNTERLIPRNPAILCPFVTSISIQLYLSHVDLFSRFCSERLADVSLTVRSEPGPKGPLEQMIHRRSVLLVKTLRRLQNLRRLSLKWSDCPFRCSKDCGILVDMIGDMQGLCRLALPLQPECLCLLRAVGKLPNLDTLDVGGWITEPRLQNWMASGSFSTLQVINMPINLASTITSLSPAPPIRAITCYAPSLHPDKTTLDFTGHVTTLLMNIIPFHITVLEIEVGESLDDTPYVNLLAALVNLEIFRLHSPTKLTTRITLDLVPKWAQLRRFDWQSLGMEEHAPNVYALWAFALHGRIEALSIPVDVRCCANTEFAYQSLWPLPNLLMLDTSQWLSCRGCHQGIVRTLRRVLPSKIIAERCIRGRRPSDDAYWREIFAAIDLTRVDEQTRSIEGNHMAKGTSSYGDEDDYVGGL